MTLLKSKYSTGEKPAPVWFVIEREPHGAIASSRLDRDAAIADFTERVHTADENGEGYTPWQRGRRVSVQGPDVHVRAPGDDAHLHIAGDDDLEDPLLHADVALHTVLTDDEYRLYVQKPLASALLES